jgi:tetratricopeptide (TPR) repeat protein
MLKITLLFLSSMIGLSAYLAVPAARAQLGKPEGLYYKSWAIIIGIERYLLAPPIPGAIDDARQVAQAFRKLGFDEVVELYDKDAVSNRLHQVFNDVLPRKVGRMDRLVIFFVGHAGAALDADGTDRGYLVPRDAQVNNVAKSVTVEELKAFTRRSASKHTLLIFDAPVFGWEMTASQPLSLEGRLAPEADTERRAVQVISAASKGEFSSRSNGRSLFVRALVAGLNGAADLDKNGWLMASELGTYLSQQIPTASAGTQHPISLRIDGDGDTALIEGRKAAFVLGTGPQTPAERQIAARAQYEQAFALLQEGKSAGDALEHLNRAIEYDPLLGDAYVLKSYVHLELVPNLDEALASGQLAVKHAPDNPDSYYTLGLIHEKRGNFADAEAAMLQALRIKADYSDIYFSLGLLYADDLNEQSKSIKAFRRYLELGGTLARARTAVTEADRAAETTP